MIGIVKVARSDWGHTQGLSKALGDRAIVVDRLHIGEGLSALVILGDRWEMAHAAVRAVYAGAAIVHLHGGEQTPNVIDNRFRHAISQMASVHCVAHEVHRDRLISMGIDSATIHVTGAPGLDRYQRSRLAREEIAEAIDLDAARPWAMILLHPTTYRPQNAEEEWTDAIEAIETTYQPVFFTPGNDPGGSVLRRRMEWYVHDHPDARLITELDDAVWIGLLHEADVVIGNSSALVIDCPFLGKKTVEIGRRQEGRERVPYGDGRSIPRILKVLEQYETNSA